jgi:hypothetical protein
VYIYLQSDSNREIFHIFRRKPIFVMYMISDHQLVLCTSCLIMGGIHIIQWGKVTEDLHAEYMPVGYRQHTIRASEIHGERAMVTLNRVRYGLNQIYYLG